MSTSFKPITISLIIILVVVNSFFFVKTLFLGDNLLKMEKEIKRLKIENSELETKLYSLNSLQHLQKVAARLGFTKKQDLLYLENLRYALSL